MSPGSDAIRRLLGTPRRRSYVASLGLGYVYTATASLLQLVLVPVLLDGLGKPRYGAWLTLYAMGQWVTLGTTWLSPGVVKEIGGHLAQGSRSAAAAVVSTGAVAYGALGALIGIIAVGLTFAERLNFLGGTLTEETRTALVLAGIWIVFTVQSQVRINLLAAAQRMYVVHAIQSAVLLTAGLASVILVSNGGDLRTITGSYAVAAALGFLAYRISSRRHLPPRHKASFQTGVLRHLLRLSIPYALSGAGWALLSADILLLAFLTDPSTVAEYGIAYLVLNGIMQLIWRLADTTQPYVVELDALGDLHGLRVLHDRVVQISTILGGAAATLLIFFGRDLIILWAGERGATEQSVLSLMALYLLVQSLVHAYFVFPHAAARMGRIGTLQLVEGFFKVVLTVALIPVLDATAVPLASVVAVSSVSLWYIPRLVMRWLDLRGPRVVSVIGPRAVPAVALTALATWGASIVLDQDDVVGMALSLLVAAMGFGLGVLIVGLRPEGFRAVASGGS